METSEEELALGFIRMGKQFTKASIIIEGTIKDVDSTSFTCTVIVSSKENGGNIDTLFYNVPLKVLKGSQASLIEIPAIDSACTVCFKNNNIQRPQLYQVDQCDKILIKISESVFNIDSDGFDFAKGSYGLKKTLSDFCDKLLQSQVLTATGPAVFDPNTITALQQIKIELGNYLK